MYKLVSAMLSRVKIKKFLYLKDIELELDRGLNVFTGETGVGKSLIVDAISFVLGKKGKYSDGDYVELEFEGAESDYAEEGLLILAREVRNGKNLYFINGRRATLSALVEASKGIISIHGQNQQQTLFDQKKHLQLLDAYSKNEKLLGEYRTLYKQLKKIQEQEKQIKQEQANRLRELDILRYQLEELKSAQLKKGEKEELEERYRYLTGIGEIKEAVYEAVNEISEGEGSVLEKLGYTIKRLEKVSDYSDRIKEALSALEEARSIIQDSYYSLEKIDLDVDTGELSMIEERLNLINRLELKYSTDLDGLIQLIDQFEERIEYLEGLEYRLPQLEEEKKQLLDKLQKLASQLSERRRINALKLAREVETHIKQLAMPEARFVVSVEETELSQDGKDRVVFLFSANKGFEPVPVDEAASGGEISRLSLALKLVVGSDVSCMIFDEIDTGIGGKTATFMAEKLKRLSEKYQVILITHLPQVAAYADRHFYIEKIYTEGSTEAVVKQVEGEERIREIARMLSGSIDEKTLQLARQMLDNALSVS